MSRDTNELKRSRKGAKNFLERLLNFEEGGMKPQINTDGHRLGKVEWKPLGEVFEIMAGGDGSREDAKGLR